MQLGVGLLALAAVAKDAAMAEGLDCLTGRIQTLGAHRPFDEWVGREALLVDLPDQYVKQQEQKEELVRSLKLQKELADRARDSTTAKASS